MARLKLCGKCEWKNINAEKPHFMQRCWWWNGSTCGTFIEVWRGHSGDDITHWMPINTPEHGPNGEEIGKDYAK